ncbi:MAG: hypothetical protein IJ306_08705 [Oscillospiraceae bacterium]|nr:hypothetical protein [Oscillospiraceae bacterium]
MKKFLALLLIFVLLFCSCQSEQPNWDVRPMMYYNNSYWKNPYMPISELPAGYEYAGTVDTEMAYNTGLEGIEYYINPATNDFYTYQETGTPIGGNTVDTTKRAMHYVQWVPIDE